MELVFIDDTTSGLMSMSAYLRSFGAGSRLGREIPRPQHCRSLMAAPLDRGGRNPARWRFSGGAA